MKKVTWTQWGVGYHTWSDWNWQMTNVIGSAEDLEKYMEVSDDLKKCLEKFQMKITPHFLSLIDWDNPNDPIKAQCIPQAGELVVEEWEKNDPLSEDEQSPVEGLVHRYPDRVLLLVSNTCAMYCRHCTRKRFAGNCDKNISVQQLNRCFQYIKQHKEIRDVLISGGDPLMLSETMIDWILSNLSSISHVEVIRIGTRVPVVLPQKITDSLCSVLSTYHPLWMNIQVNHPNEISQDTAKALNKLASSGIPLGNQSVLLRRINDNVETMTELVHVLVKNRVRPYYLYQCDLSYGLSHFRTPIQTGIDIIRGMRGFTSGFCIPQFVIDSPNGGGKVPINPNYIQDWTDEKISLFNYKGEVYEYPEIHKKED